MDKKEGGGGQGRGWDKRVGKSKEKSSGKDGSF